MVRKQKPGTSLSLIQKKMLFRISLAIILMVLVWLVFAPGRGILYVRSQKQHLATLEAEQELLIRQNEKMKHTIERLQNDKEYLEQVAREEHGMLKDNEMVFDFSKKKKQKE